MTEKKNINGLGKRAICVNLPTELLTRLDVWAKKERRNRSISIEMLVDKALKAMGEK